MSFKINLFEAQRKVWSKNPLIYKIHILPVVSVVMNKVLTVPEVYLIIVMYKYLIYIINVSGSSKDKWINIKLLRKLIWTVVTVWVIWYNRKMFT